MTNLQAGWHHIQTLEVVGGDATITFSSIPQTFDHLQALIQVRGTIVSSGLAALGVRLNSDATNTYWSTANWISASGVKSNSGFDGNQTAISGGVIPNHNATTTLSNLIMSLMGYTDTTITKSGSIIGGSWAGPNAATSEYALSLSSFRWNSTAAITAIQFGRANSAASMMNILDIGSRVSLYGVLESTV